MSVNIDLRVVGPGDDDHVDEAWKLKEAIRHEEGVLKQRKGFFADAYRRSTATLVLENGENLIGFAAARRDGYMLFLAVHPDYRGEGFGERLVADLAERYSSVTCHARTTNENALQFYEHLGFEIVRRIDNYYEDGGDAYYLKLGTGDGLTGRLAELLRR